MSGWLLETLLKRWYVIAVLAVVGGALAVISANWIRPVYRSEALLAPVQTDGGASGLNALLGQFGGLASLAGVDLPQRSDSNVAVETLRSRDLAVRLIESENLLPVLFGDRWDAARHAWKENEQPTLNEALLLFDRRVRAVRQDPRTGMVRIGVEWTDPVAATAWTSKLIEMTNRVLREREISEAEQTIAALQLEIENASNLEVRTALYRLIEAQLKSKSVAAGREQFAFRVIDPALAPDADKPIWPRRSVLAALGLAIGATLGLLVVLLFAPRGGSDPTRRDSSPRATLQ
jgi:uncharacterized protein involved in exopolysaccharide biosynthesis